MVYYRLFEETRSVDDGKEYEAYGVAAFDDNGELICAAPDITAVKEKAIELAKVCERLQLSQIHLMDIANDYIISDNY